MSDPVVDPHWLITDRGPDIGTYRDAPIAEWLMQRGARWNYDRHAVLDAGGGCHLSQLRADEFVVAPGLIYRRVR